MTTPISTCRYHHRILNPKKVIEVGFSQVGRNMTLARTIKLYKLPKATSTIGLRPITKEDFIPACNLLNTYLKQFKLYTEFSLVDFTHWFDPHVMYVYVVEDPISHQITDMISFYSISSTVLNNPKHQSLSIAYLWYTVATKTPIDQLVNDILIISHNMSFDVFNCLDIFDNNLFISKLKFVPGNGHLNYYLYNWLTKPIQENEIEIILV